MKHGMNNPIKRGVNIGSRSMQCLAVALALTNTLVACSPVATAPVAMPSTMTAATATVTATKVASVEGITEYRLDNGLRVLLFPDQSKQQITVNVTYLVGSRHENYGETGMAHLLEHLLFKGSTNYPNVDDELSERGAFANGTTWLDRTNYYEIFPANEDNLDWALDFEADRMINSFIASEALESEMTVVRSEWELGENDPGLVLRKRVASAAYLWHNYGNAAIGARSDLENVPIDRLRAFYRKYYQPDNAVLVIAGRFDPEWAMARVKARFGAIPRPRRDGINQLFDTYTAEPAQDGERIVTLRRVGDVQWAVAAYHVPAGSHQQFAAVDVLAHLLGTKPAGRLYGDVVEQKLATSVSVESFQYREPSLLFVAAQVRQNASLAAATEAMLKTLHGLEQNPPTVEEVERAKAKYASDFELVFNNPQAIAVRLSEWAAMGDWRLMFLHRDRIEKVTPNDVLAVARAYLKPSNRTIGYFHPTDATPPRAHVPRTPDVAALVTDYTGRETITQGEAFDPTPENIDRRTQKLTLTSGVKVALLPKRNRGGAVTFYFAFRHGTERALLGKSTAARFAGDMLMRGTTRRSHQELIDEFDRLRIRGYITGDALSASGRATTVRENLPAVLRLTAEILREPAFDANEFELLRQEYLADIEAQRSEPRALVWNAADRHLNSHYPKGHVFYTPTFDERLANYKTVTVADARDFWAAFYGAEGGTLSVIGDFEPGAITPVLEQAFGGWNATRAYQRVDKRYRDIAPVNSDIETPDKTNATMLAMQIISMRDDHRDYPALLLANYMLGGGFLNSRLATRLRQQDGLSYGVSSDFSADPIDQLGVFEANAIFAPENGDRVLTAYREEMARALSAGFTEAEVAAAKRGYLDRAQNARSHDSRVAVTLSSNLFLDRTMAFIARQEAAIEALTPAEILAALRRHIDLDKVAIFRGGDFANKLPN